MIEHRIRFGRIAEGHRLDRHRRIVGFSAGSIFAFVRWAGNEYGTVISRIDIVRAVATGEPFQTLPFVRPGGDILLRLVGWRHVEIVLNAIEALGIDPADVAPDHWRHIANRIAVTALIAAPVWSRPDIRFIWNASASVPVGLYRIVPATRVEVTDLAVVMPPTELATFLDERGYLPRSLPLIKRVLALSGTEICRNANTIIAYGTTYGVARDRDTRGRPLPAWQGCRTLRNGEAFFMNWDSPDSFDSRYFGPLPLSTIVGRAVPVWTTGDPHPAAESFREPSPGEP